MTLEWVDLVMQVYYTHDAIVIDNPRISHFAIAEIQQRDRESSGPTVMEIYGK